MYSKLPLSWLVTRQKHFIHVGLWKVWSYCRWLWRWFGEGRILLQLPFLCSFANRLSRTPLDFPRSSQGQYLRLLLSFRNLTLFFFSIIIIHLLQRLTSIKRSTKTSSSNKPSSLCYSFATWIQSWITISQPPLQCIQLLQQLSPAWAKRGLGTALKTP